MPYQPQLVIGECKAAGGTITRQDAEHLAKVADTFPYRRLNVFILFAKPGSFSAEEVEACSLAQHKWHQRVILLGKDELEPYHIDDRYPEGVRLRLAENLEDLAGNTVRALPATALQGHRLEGALSHHQRVPDVRRWSLLAALPHRLFVVATRSLSTTWECSYGSFSVGLGHGPCASIPLLPFRASFATMLGEGDVIAFEIEGDHLVVHKVTSSTNG